MFSPIRRSISIGTLCIVFISAPITLGQKTLGISPVYQQTPVWCWAAVGEMVFRYYGVSNINPAGNFQCGIIALLHPVCDVNCGNCVVPAGSLTTMVNMLTRYPAFASQRTRTDTRISVLVRGGVMSYAEVVAEIDAGRPIVAGISPSGYRNNAGVSEHVAVIAGYSNGNLIVNDPFPFTAVMFAGDPYLAASGQQISPGQYSVPYIGFGTRLQWRETIYSVTCQGANCRNAKPPTVSGPSRHPQPIPPPPPPAPAVGHSCQTQMMRCGPFPQSAPLGSDCFCNMPWGPAPGIVVLP